MGFHKRFITKDSIMSCKNFEDIDILFRADALFLDDWSQKFVDNYDQNWKSYQKNRQEIIEKYKLSSSITEDITFSKNNISNILINLKNEPSLVDIKLCNEYFSEIEKIPNISEKIELLSSFYIDLIEGEFQK